MIYPPSEDTGRELEERGTSVPSVNVETLKRSGIRDMMYYKFHFLKMLVNNVDTPVSRYDVWNS